MTIEQLLEQTTGLGFPMDMELRVEFGIDHHVPIERIDEHHPEGESTKENYLLLILE